MSCLSIEIVTKQSESLFIWFLYFSLDVSHFSSTRDPHMIEKCRIHTSRNKLAPKVGTEFSSIEHNIFLFLKTRKKWKKYLLKTLDRALFWRNIYIGWSIYFYIWTKGLRRASSDICRKSVYRLHCIFSECRDKVRPKLEIYMCTDSYLSNRWYRYLGKSYRKKIES